MKIKEYEKSIEFYPYPKNTFFSVVLYKPRTIISGYHIDAVINWGCPGSETPDNAELYGKALIAAAKMARKLNKKCQQTNTQQRKV